MILLYLATLVTVVTNYKIAIFTPDISKSQIQLNARVGETLADAGHDVTMVVLNSFPDYVMDDVKIPKNVKVHIGKGHVNWTTKAEHDKRQSEAIFGETSIFDGKMIGMLKNFSRLLEGGCEKLLQNEDFLSYLTNEKFDVAYSHMYNFCPIGLIHKAGIPSWIWLNSGLLADNVADLTGVPIIPSYVSPMFQASTDRMTFRERVNSFIGHLAVKGISGYIKIPSETKIFRDAFGSDFPDLGELAAKCPLVIVNSNDLYDNPRPLLAKVINVGGLGMGFETAKPLKPEFEKIVNSSEGVVVFSLGSVASAHEMPLAWKDAFLDAFRQFPNIAFFVRYEEADLNDRLPPNVHLSRWLPQKDLLLHPKTKAFITHGGYNSLQEAISAGVPLVTIPLFGDQPKNAALAEKHGFGVIVRKSAVTSEAIAGALDKILKNPSFSEKVKRFSEMVKHQPVKASELVVRWTEFVARFKTLDNLIPGGQHLNFFQYHSIDVILTLFFIVFVVLFLLFKLFKFVLFSVVLRLLRKISGSSKVKNE